MGYYIDFVDPEISISREEVISRLNKAGATRFKESYYEMSTTNIKTGKLMVNPKLCGLYTDFIYDGLCSAMKVRGYPREHYQLKGNWMDTRTSWGCSPEDIISVWETVFELAEKVGCWVYDGQKRGFVFPEDIDRMARFFFKIASGMTGLFGTVRTDTTNLQ